ncbi:MarR family transcriptional regulator [Tianweitania sp. BSSL-BM11]|uniref:MarR family transcriptional regulator n=1 Tax=Tianweitania aestuarii TaxID=2814886 RepID=A0ABS5RQ97_9HYPH|nr:MarR family transcriptional regulator [Tianweitania aestuarii]MBS9719186.1 MarR family transcriptional regulator [Tianweitania aestuarii]
MDAIVEQTAFMDELTKVSRKMRTLFDARVKEQGLTLARARILLLLAKTDGMTQSQLAEALEVEQPSVVSLIDALEKTGLVLRCAVEGDRRAKAIYLTDLAREQADNLLSYIAELRRQVLGGVGKSDLAAATRVLQQVSSKIGALV